MTTAAVPSIKISKTGPNGVEAPVTPISDGGTDSEQPVNSSRRDSKSLNGSAKKASSVGTAATEEKVPNASRPKKGTLHRDGSSVDPLTMQILRRTGTENTIPQKLRQDSADEVHTVGNDGGAIPTGRNSPDVGKDPQFLKDKDKKKGVSFLSRIMGSKKKGDGSEDGESIDGDRRMEGMDAQIFSQPLGYIPQHAAPPRYIRVRSHHKPQRDFNQTFLAQELHRGAPSLNNASKLGDATASEPPRSPSSAKKDGAVWAMKFSKDGRYLAAAGQDKVVRVWQVISSKEEREAHEKEEDAAGSASGFSNIGGGVRLNAPVFKTEPVREYYGHTADVLDLSWSKNNFLLSSSMDKTVRLWHVTRPECLCCFQHKDFVTSICFHPRDDRFFLAGSLDSKLRLWSIPDKNVAFWNELPDLITAVAFTPDGRMAIAGCLSGLCYFYETEGLRYNTQLHVKSSRGRNAKGSKITGIETINFPPDDPNGEVKVLITSNDSRVRLYNARDKSLETKFKGYENTCSQIHATFSDDAKYIISGSEDRRVYIWNIAAGNTDTKDKRPVEFFEANPAIVTVAITAPTKTRQLLSSSGDPVYDLCNPPPITLVSRSDSVASSKKAATESKDSNDGNSVIKPAEGSPAYIARSSHHDGNIIVTADYTGRIKVFRQDCAFVKRRSDSWETASIMSKKLGTGILRRSSLNQGNPDRINNWRNSIASMNSLEGSLRNGRASLVDGSSLRERSSSPRKSASTMSINSVNTSKFRQGSSLRSRANSTATRDSHRNSKLGGMQDSPRSPPPEVKDPLMIQETGQSLAFYGPLPERKSPSKHLSSDESNDEAEDIFSSEEEEEEEEEELRCKKCGSMSFKAKQSRKGEHRLVCTKCNTVL